MTEEAAARKVADEPVSAPGAAVVDMKLEVVVIAVSDMDRAKAFYQKLGWRLDADRASGDSRIIQFTPPGSGCSVQFGGNRTSAAPGSAQGLWLIVSDLQAALDKLAAAGIKADDVYHVGANGKSSGLDPERNSYRSFASFKDPDGNRWLFQEVTARLAGRVNPTVTSFGSASDLASAMRRAEAAHGEHEKRTGQRDENWPAWYAAYIAAEQAGTELPT
jgi:catechol 2,3-dioxygenase-like lactoylglutathione lyase family enzyme